jgi:hypothetical protein
VPDKLIRIKWAGPNTPYINIERDDERIYITKREMLDLLVELKGFVEFYKESFVEPSLDYNDELSEDELVWIEKLNE